MTLSELAAKLDMPPSSCLLIIRTLLTRGYLYSTGRRNAYYPTSRIADVAREITRNDPIVERFQPHLERLRDATSETVALAKRQGDKLIYLATAESREVVRATVRLGLRRALHATATGKALLAAADPAGEEPKAQDAPALERLTDRTIVSPAELRQAIDETRRRGYAVNSGESVAGLSAVSIAIPVADDTYAITIMGPSQRVDPKLDEYGRTLVKYAQTLKEAFSGRSEPVSGPWA